MQKRVATAWRWQRKSVIQHNHSVHRICVFVQPVGGGNVWSYCSLGVSTPEAICTPRHNICWCLTYIYKVIYRYVKFKLWQKIWCVIWNSNFDSHKKQWPAPLVDLCTANYNILVCHIPTHPHPTRPSLGSPGWLLSWILCFHLISKWPACSGLLIIFTLLSAF